MCGGAWSDRPGTFLRKNAPQGFWWVGIGGLLISLGGIALAFISAGSQLLFFSPAFVMQILRTTTADGATLSALGFMKDIKG